MSFARNADHSYFPEPNGFRAESGFGGDDAPDELEQTGSFDRAVPRALWRLMQIGERAGLSASVHRAHILEAFVGMPLVHSDITRVLQAFELDVTELYLLVTLFSADPHPVMLSVLAREVLRDRAHIRGQMAHLERQGLVVRPLDEADSADAPIRLTEFGRETAVYAIYRTVSAAKTAGLAGGPSPRGCSRS